jgi:hypothetical protein
MYNSNITKAVPALPIVIFVMWTQLSSNMANHPFYGGLAFLMFAIYSFYAAFMGDKNLEFKYGNNWRGAMILTGLLFILFSFTLMYKDQNIIFTMIVGLSYLLYLYLIGKLFPSMVGTKGSISNIFGRALKLLLISLSVVLLIGSLAFILIIYLK